MRSSEAETGQRSAGEDRPANRTRAKHRLEGEQSQSLVIGDVTPCECLGIDHGVKRAVKRSPPRWPARAEEYDARRSRRRRNMRSSGVVGHQQVQLVHYGEERAEVGLANQIERRSAHTTPDLASQMPLPLAASQNDAGVIPARQLVPKRGEALVGQRRDSSFDPQWKPTIGWLRDSPHPSSCLARTRSCSNIAMSMLV